MSVEYRPIPGFPGYLVGSDGSIWTERQSWLHRTGRHRIKPHLSPYGYLIVTLMRDRKKETRRVHRVVLEAFVCPCPDGMEACHFPDIDRTNNALSNLRWDTKHGNRQDMVNGGTALDGERHPLAKLTAPDVIAIREAYATGNVTMPTLAKRYGVSDSKIWQIVAGKSWKHLLPNRNGQVTA